MNETDADHLDLLDRLKKRLPELGLNQHEVEWIVLADGHEALLVDGGGVDGGAGMFFANAGCDVHAFGPLTEGAIGCVVFKPDKTRVLARAVPDPLAQQK